MPKRLSEYKFRLILRRLHATLDVETLEILSDALQIAYEWQREHTVPDALYNAKELTRRAFEGVRQEQETRLAEGRAMNEPPL